MEHATVTLLEDFAENDGVFLEKLKDDKPILGLCDVTLSIYKSTFEISTISMSSILINPQYQKSTDLSEMVKAENKDFMVTPSKEMRRAIEVPLVYIMDGLLADSQFKPTIVDILNKDEPWYSSCKKCSKKVKVTEHIVSCNNCTSENIEYEMRLDLVKT
ncbi:hypothetical protein R3W88_019059 [Solanum pinnatisectum]|uniref:Replication factor A C-terminal domain-containing protein n=1 Tax=Solanum pinnatisectum TaxID=50273 RepID=A0AAV9KIF8_9SOLN|nr:hypothetical protein R3W88_019059 [Solanum pinnatisectum]